MPTTDGRHARSDRTRATAAEAMLDCFEEGLLRPGAKDVAERAGVSTRAVFRHFDNMEALIEEASGATSNGTGDVFVGLIGGNSVDKVRRGLLDFDIAGNVPAGATERGFALLNYFAVAATRPIEALQIAVNNKHQVVEAFAYRHRDGAHRLRLIHFAITTETPDLAV